MFHATKLKRLVFFLLGDVFIFIFSIYAAYLLRFNADIPDIYVQGLFVTAGFLIVFKLFFMWIFKKWFTKKLNIVFHFTFLSVAFIIAYLKLPKLFIGMFGRFSVYAELLTIETPITKVLVMFFLGVIIVYFLRNKDDKKTNLLLNILQIGIFINIVFAEFPPVTRMGYYFVITQTVLVPAIIFSFKYNYFRIFSLVLFMTYYSFIQINALITDEKQSETIKMTPYKSYLDK